MTELRSELDLFEHSSQDLEHNLEVLYSRRDDVREWAKAWKTYYSDTVSEESIAEWVLQHVQPYSVLEAFRVLDCIRFVSETELAELLRELFGALPASVQSAGRFFAAGGLHDSTGPVGYAFGKWLGLKEAEFAARQVKSLESLTEDDTALVLLDDNIGSGTQLIDTLRGWMGEDSTNEIGQPLTSEAASRLRGVELHWLHAFALADGDQSAELQARKLGINLRVHVAQRFHNSVFDGMEKQAATRARRTISSIGQLLTADKAWSHAVQAERVLGHGNLARCVVFSHNVPKSLLTSLWKFGRLSSGNWTPLFPERDEWRLHAPEISRGNPYLRVLSRKVLSGLTARKNSNLVATMTVDGARDDVTVALSAIDDSFEARVPNWLRSLRVPHVPFAEFELRNERVQSSRHLGLLGGTFEPVTKEMARAFNASVEGYNSELDAYAEKLRAELKHLTRVAELRLVLANAGTVFAKKIRVELTLPPGERRRDRSVYPSSPPKPPVRPEPRYRARQHDLLASFRPSPISMPDYSRDIFSIGRSFERSQWDPYEEKLADGRQRFVWNIDELRQGSEKQLIRLVYRFASENERQEIAWKWHSEDMPSPSERLMSISFVRDQRASKEVMKAIEALTGQQRERDASSEEE